LTGSGAGNASPAGQEGTRQSNRVKCFRARFRRSALASRPRWERLMRQKPARPFPVVFGIPQDKVCAAFTLHDLSAPSWGQ
jgi:hypothetical protein